MSKQIISMLLTVVLLFGMLPVAATAENADPAAEVDTGDVSIEGTNGFGTLLSEEINEAQAAEEEAYEAGYTVTDLVIEGNTATVTYDTMEEATLVVAIYTEDGMQMLTSGKATVYPDVTEAAVTIEGEMPEYFMAEAFLLDTYDFSPLCKSYSTPMYTQEMQELLESTVEDYDADRVLNLDDDNTTNFAVYAEDTIVIEAQEGINTVASVDDETSTYVIENADESITSLAEGDVFAYPYDENEILIVKVAAISIDGTTATITGDDTLEMEEAFSHLKIQATADPNQVIVDDSTSAEGVDYEEPVTPAIQTFAWEGDLSDTATLKFKLTGVKLGDEYANVQLAGSLKVDVGAELEYYISRDYQRLEFRVTSGLEVNASLSGALSSDKAKVPIGIITMPILPGISVDLEPKFVVKASAAITFSLGFGGTLGFCVDHDEDNWDWNPILETSGPDASVKIKGELFVGLELTPALNILGGYAASAELEGEIGVEFTSKTDPYSHDGDTHHLCNECYDGDISFKVGTSAKVKFLNMKKLSAEAELYEGEWKFGDFYFCLHHLEEGFGPCPNHVYSVTVSVEDNADNPVSGAKVTLDGQEKETDKNGIATFFVKEGKHTIQARKDGISEERTLKVEEPQKTRFVLDANDANNGGIHDIFEEVNSGSITDYGTIVASGECGAEGDNITWTLDSNGLLTLTGSGAMKDYEFDWNEWEGGLWLWDSAFKPYLNLIKSVKINEGITSIGNSGFSKCNNLTSVDLPDSLTSIGWGAFWHCGITEIDLPKQLGSIGSWSFMYTPIETLVIPDSVTYIGSRAFRGSSLKDVYISSMESWCSISFGYYGSPMNYAENLYVGNGIISDTIVIPQGTKTINADTFSNIDNLTSVVIPNSVTSIGEYAFHGCDSLSSVTIPDSVTSIESHTFASCYSLNSVTIPDGVTSIEAYAFSWCYSLNSVTIPDSVTYINYRAFQECNSLTDVYYSGTEEQWNAIRIEFDNGDLTSATIHYNSTGPVAAANEISFSQDTPVLYSVYDGEYGAEITDTYILKTAYFSDLVPGEEYVLLAMVSIEVEDVLSADNLLCIDQATALEDGTLEFQYVQRTPAEISYVVACGASNQDLKDAKITFPAMQAKNEVQAVDPTVVYDGKTLTEGKDYVIVGTVDYTEAGEYTCAIRGIRNYTGLVECTYVVEKKTFVDVVPGAYYEEPVLWAVDIGITNGVDDTHFAPDNKCTREQVVTFLWRAVGCPEPSTTTHPFVDVRAGSYYEKAVLWAVENGITNGMDDTHFGPSVECTRAQVAMFLWRTLDKPTVNASANPFKDVAQGQWFYEPVLWAVETGVTNGLEPNQFAPDATCTRGQIVTFLYRALG